MIDSLTAGGAESSLAAMAPGLVQRGVHLEVVALTARPGVQEALARAGATLTELGGSRHTWWREIRSLVRERHPHLVHTTLFEADLAGRIGARLAGTPVVSTLASESYGPSHRLEHRDRRVRLLAAQTADALTAHLATRLHAVSVRVADTAAHRLRYPRRKIDVIPRGRDPETLGQSSPERRSRVRYRLGLAPDTPLVIAVARHERAKGLDVLIDAVPHVLHDVPRARFLVAGRPGNASASLHEQRDHSSGGSALELLGAREDVADLLCAADVFVLPSRREGLPGALLEAMALECPAVVTDLPQVREVVDPTMASLVAPEDPRALADAILDVLEHPQRARVRALHANQRFSTHFTIDSVVDRMMSFYEGVLGRPN